MTDTQTLLAALIAESMTAWRDAVTEEHRVQRTESTQQGAPE